MSDIDARAEAHALLLTVYVSTGCLSERHTAECNLIQRAHDAGQASALALALGRIRSAQKLGPSRDAWAMGWSAAVVQIERQVEAAAAPPPAGTQ